MKRQRFCHDLVHLLASRILGGFACFAYNVAVGHYAARTLGIRIILLVLIYNGILERENLKGRSQVLWLIFSPCAKWGLLNSRDYVQLPFRYYS